MDDRKDSTALANDTTAAASARPTAIVVASYCPFPPTHGNRRRLLSLFNWLRGEGFRIVFVLQPNEVDDGALVRKLGDVVDRYVVVDRPQSRLGSLLARTRFRHRLPRLRRLWPSRNMDRMCWPTTISAVRSAVVQHQPVVVISEYAYFSRALVKLPRSVLTVIDTVEVFQRDAGTRERAGFTNAFSPRSEARALQRADVLVAIQRHDADALRRIAPRRRVVTVEHSYALLRQRAPTVNRGAILYVASSNPYNRDGLAMFLRQAWPIIRRAQNEAALHVVGALSEADVGRHDAVSFRGYVTDGDLADMYATAHVVINPQTSGTGLKIKCVEALTAGCPLVINQAGADGLDAGIGTAFLVARDWDEFAAHVLRLLRDEDYRRQLEARAREFAARRFAEAVVFQELARALDEHRTAVRA